ncbi:GMC family oxidoreductase [Sphingorhabdus sp. EL138]|uniref:GMC family oxidoreductase n=1 Tax=Sphingorhabdus sp. EL138 TaxID=2073156 RepID=UPI000D698982|nr:choline dehydrogenase [Sphingorhabdus sp. EL138]
MQTEFDYVIVGAGSAGCAIAARLTENPNISVCLLEAGSKDSNPLIHIPAGVVGLMPGGKNNWAFETVPQKGLNGRTGYQPRGKTLGGSSSINAMVYIRGHRNDYDRWEKEGATGWSYDDVLPYFKKLENFEPGADQYHGTGGPLNATTHRTRNPLNEHFLEAGRQLQLPATDDFNGAQQEGLGWYHVTQKDGQRHSAARAYLYPNMDRSNLTIITDAKAQKIDFEGKRATGVSVTVKGRTGTIKSKCEVIVSAGAFQSPQLLMLSGVGPAAHLQSHGIDVVHDSAEVGQNLQDHIDYVLSYSSPSTGTFGFSVRGFPKMLGEMWKYWRKREGMFASNITETGAFLKSNPDLEHPDLQLHFVTALVDDHGRKLHWGHGISCHVCVLRPKSKGSVTLGSNDVSAAPVIDPNFLTEDEDMKTLLNGTKLTRRIMEAPAFDAIRGKELYLQGIESDDDLEAEIRGRADTVYHPVGTCRMGSDAGAVVDTELRVNGLEGLRVADASIMPSLISGNTNAPSIMIGERAADFMKQAAAGQA